MRQKTCPACKTKFTPARPLQVACGWECAIQHTANLKAKRERKEKREAKARLKSRADFTREAQAAFNRWIRHRDADQPCISCGRHHQGQYHAGHFRTTKAAGRLSATEEIHDRRPEGDQGRIHQPAEADQAGFGRLRPCYAGRGLGDGFEAEQFPQTGVHFGFTCLPILPRSKRGMHQSCRLCLCEAGSFTGGANLTV